MPEREAHVVCPHADRCGGCPLIALPYAAQLERKQLRVARALGAFPALQKLELRAVVPADAVEHYRVRAKLVVAPVDRIGLYAGAQHEVVDIPGCRVLTPSLALVCDRLRALLRNPEPAFGSALVAHTEHGTGALCAVDLREARSGEEVRVLVTLILAEERAVSRAELVAASRALLQLAPCVHGVAVSWRAARSIQVLGRAPELIVGESFAPDDIAGIVHQASFGSFVQVHPGQAAKLHDAVVRGLDAALMGLAGRRVVELYAGSGAFGLALAAHAAEITLIEQQAPAARAAERSASTLKRGTVRTLCGDAAEVAAQLAARGERFDAVLVNPPRRGLSPGARRAAASLRPSALAYVSCNPDTFARDLDHFARLGFTAAHVAPVDMIPLSDEVESCAILLPSPIPAPVVLYRDERLLAIDKPAHESTTPQGERDGSLLARVQQLPDARHAVPIHRLDAGTSGVCLFARTASAASHFAKLLGSGEKRYVALVRGITPRKGVVNRPLRDAGRECQARTRYRRLAIAGGHSLLAVLPDQGRKHQIRRHLASIGHPVVGDNRYGHPGTNRHFEERYALDRTFLHCERIVLNDAGRRFELESPLPGELRLVTEGLAQRSEAKLPTSSGHLGVLLSANLSTAWSN